MMELWRDCALWLERLHLVPPESPLAAAIQPGQSGQLTDLVAHLRDGVVLCQLVHSLDPECIDMTRILTDSHIAYERVACCGKTIPFASKDL